MPTLPIVSANAVLRSIVSNLLRRKVSCPSWVTGRFLMFVCFRHSFTVAEQSNQSISYAANFVLARLLSPSKTRRFLIFDVVDDIDDLLSRTSRFLVVDELDDAFDAAENDDGDIDEDEFVDDREDTVEGVESNGRDTTTDEPTTLAMV